jgi:hypothetical protein
MLAVARMRDETDLEDPWLQLMRQDRYAYVCDDEREERVRLMVSVNHKGSKDAPQTCLTEW